LKAIPKRPLTGDLCVENFFANFRIINDDIIGIENLHANISREELMDLLEGIQAIFTFHSKQKVENCFQKRPVISRRFLSFAFIRTVAFSELMSYKQQRRNCHKHKC
jgi:hypothetical protein